MQDKQLWADRLSPIIHTQQDIIRERGAFFNRIKETFFRNWDKAVREDVARAWGLFLPPPPSPEAWRIMPERGWLVLDAEPARPYVTSIWQVGRWLRIGTKVHPRLLGNVALQEAISSIFYDTPCHLTIRGDGYLFDWMFDVPDLYSSMVEQETWIMALLHLHEMVGNLITQFAEHDDKLSLSVNPFGSTLSEEDLGKWE